MGQHGVGGSSGWVGPPLLGHDPGPLPALTLILVAPARYLALVSRGEGAAGLRQADGLDKLGADSAALPFLLQPDQDWAREVGGQPAPREPVTAEGGHGVTWGAARWATGLCPGRPRRELQATFPLLLTSSLPPPHLSHPSPQDSPRPAWRLLPAYSPGQSLTEVVVTGVEHGVQWVRDVLLYAKRLCHVRRAVEEVLAQDHGDAFPGGAVRQGLVAA